ncbi:Uncharacterized protein ALO87_00236 [Pseudomonas syringae pv. apii]|nr:Uncharacterized protein ALO87_00236 [Pseudomonas syringae pv. apii]
MPTVTLDHAGQRQPGDLQHGAQVHIDQQINTLGIRLEQRAGPVNPGIIDHHIKPLSLEQGRQASQISHINSVRDATGTLRQRRQFVGTACQRMNLQAFGTQPFDHSFANTGGSAGDQRGFVIGKRHVGVSFRIFDQSRRYQRMRIALYWTLTSVTGSDQDAMVVWR